MSNSDTSVHVANTAVAQTSFDQHSCSRWYKKDASADEINGTLAFQRLRQPLFTPAVEPAFKLHSDDKFFAIGSCFAGGIEGAARPQNGSLKRGKGIRQLPNGQ